MFAVYFLLKLVTFSHLSYLNNQADICLDQKDYPIAKEWISKIDNQWVDNEKYWENLARLSFASKDLNLATRSLENEIKLTSDPDVYIALGKCYQQAKRFREAENSFLIANQIQPSLQQPKSLLAKNYLLAGDKIKALEYAYFVLDTSQIIGNKKSQFYQQEAEAIIKSIKQSNF